MPDPDTRLTLTPATVAALTGLQPWTARGLMADGRIRSVDIGRAGQRHWRTCEAWLAEYLGGTGAAAPHEYAEHGVG